MLKPSLRPFDLECTIQCLMKERSAHDLDKNGDAAWANYCSLKLWCGSNMISYTLLQLCMLSINLNPTVICKILHGITLTTPQLFVGKWEIWRLFPIIFEVSHQTTFIRLVYDLLPFGKIETALCANSVRVIAWGILHVSGAFVGS